MTAPKHIRTTTMPARADNVTSIHSTDGNNDNMSEILSVSLTDDKESTVGTIAPAAVPNPEIERVREVLATMKQTLSGLGVSHGPIYGL